MSFSLPFVAFVTMCTEILSEQARSQLAEVLLTYTYTLHTHTYNESVTFVANRLGLWSSGFIWPCHENGYSTSLTLPVAHVTASSFYTTVKTFLPFPVPCFRVCLMVTKVHKEIEVAEMLREYRYIYIVVSHGTRKKNPRKRSPRKKSHQGKWFAEKKSPRKKSPQEKNVLEKKIPGKLVLGEVSILLNI